VSEVTVNLPPQIATAPVPLSLSNLSTSAEGQPQDIPRKPVEIAMEGAANERRKQPRYLNARLIRIDEVEQICALSRSRIYTAIKLGTFPPPIKTGLRASAWVRQEVEQWVEQCIAQSRRSKPK
jgi:prophage regulatory protein